MNNIKKMFFNTHGRKLIRFISGECDPGPYNIKYQSGSASLGDKRGKLKEKYSNNVCVSLQGRGGGQSVLQGTAYCYEGLQNI